MNQQFLILMLAMLSSTSIAAQEKELNKQQKAQMEAQLTMYNEALDLSKEQKTKFEQITKKYAAQMKALRDSDQSRFAKYKEFKSIQKNKDEEMEALLSEEQFERYLEIQKEVQQKVKKRSGKKE